jgi:glucose-1-phosphate thymidylyltransferase
MPKTTDYIGLFPAGGRASRLGKLACSKEILKVPNASGAALPVGQFLLQAYRSANIQKVYIILRDNKWDIASEFGNGSKLGLSIAYLPLQYPWGTPFTLDQAWPFIKDANVALGFPDIILQPSTAFIALQQQLESSDKDIVLGLFKTDSPHKADMVNTDDDGNVLALEIKPVNSCLSYTWVIAVWRPSFSLFMHQYLSALKPLFLSPNQPAEPYVGSVINAAINNNFKVGSVVIGQGRMLDIGTSDDLKKAQDGAFFNPQPKKT